MAAERVAGITAVGVEGGEIETVEILTNVVGGVGGMTGVALVSRGKGTGTRGGVTDELETRSHGKADAGKAATSILQCGHPR